MSDGLCTKKQVWFSDVYTNRSANPPRRIQILAHIPAVFTQRSPQREARSVKRSEKEQNKDTNERKVRMLIVASSPVLHISPPRSYVLFRNNSMMNLGGYMFELGMKNEYVRKLRPVAPTPNWENRWQWTPSPVEEEDTESVSPLAPRKMSTAWTSPVEEEETEESNGGDWDAGDSGEDETVEEVKASEPRWKTRLRNRRLAEEFAAAADEAGADKAKERRCHSRRVVLVFGSMWVRHPEHGLVRRSARIAARNNQP